VIGTGRYRPAVEYPNFSIERPAEQPGRVEVLINRPDKRNAMTVAMWQTLATIATDLAREPELRVVVISGLGPTFCAGADIGALAADDAIMRGVVGAAEAALVALPVPTIAKIRGNCMGGGTQIAIACDLRIADETARFAVPPARLGVVYAAASIRALTALVGPGQARRLLFTAETIDAATALRIGLVEDVVPKGESKTRALDWAKRAAGQSPMSVAACKRLIQSTRTATHASSLVVEREAFVDLFDGADQAEGVAAFFEKRPAQWKNA
jgi:enoyl-CoA hydratase/carnithine racemase